MVGVHYFSAFRLLSEHVQGQGAGSYPMLSLSHGMLCGVFAIHIVVCLLDLYH